LGNPNRPPSGGRNPVLRLIPSEARCKLPTHTLIPASRFAGSGTRKGAHQPGTYALPRTVRTWRGYQIWSGRRLHALWILCHARPAYCASTSDSRDGIRTSRPSRWYYLAIVLDLQGGFRQNSPDVFLTNKAVPKPLKFLVLGENHISSVNVPDNRCMTRNITAIPLNCTAGYVLQWDSSTPRDNYARTVSSVFPNLLHYIVSKSKN